MSTKTVDIEIGKLKLSEFNPLTRIEPKNLEPMIESMKVEGFWYWNPITTDKNGVIGDGHRRYMASVAVGLSTVPVICVKELTAQEIWSKLNGLRRTIKGADVAEAVTLGLDIDVASRYINVSDTKAILKIGNKELLQEVVNARVSPRIVSIARGIAKICNDRSDEFIASAIRWMIKRNAQKLAKYVVDYDGADYGLGIQPTDLYLAIIDDADLVLTLKQKGN